MVTQWIQSGRLSHWPAGLSSEDKQWILDWLEGSPQMTFFTSGTTGQPKEIYFSREQIITSAQRTAIFFDLKDNQNVLHTLPFTFVAGKMNVLRALILKQNLWSIDWRIRTDWEKISQMHFHWWTCTPMMIRDVINNGVNIDFIEKVLLGGGAIPNEVLKQIQTFPNTIFEGYGMTETLTHIAIRKVGHSPSFFTPLEGVECTISENETLIIKDNALKNVVKTSDLVKFNERGDFLVLGRADDVINSGGVKIFPTEVEKCMRSHMTAEFVVVKAPHVSLGEQVVCLHTAANDVKDEAFWKKVFQDQPYWRPKQFIHVEKLPYNTNGKLNRNWKIE